ncbi:MAG: lysophospholipid acyltransferase family protein [Gaiellaceae bacterium]
MKASPFFSLAARLSWPLIHWVYRLRVEGLEHVPASGGFVLAANHTSNFEPWPLGMPLFPPRFLRFMAKSELYWWPLGPFLHAAGAFPVRRGERDTGAIERGIELAREGNTVVMFPEGTRQRKGMRKKWEARPHSGAARIALEAGVPLVPAAIAGTDRLARLERLRVRYGAPLDLSDLAGLEPKEAAGVATERLMAEIRRLHEGL